MIWEEKTWDEHKECFKHILNRSEQENFKTDSFMLDYIGNTLKVGDKVVFATSKGYNEPLRKGIIHSFTEFKFYNGNVLTKANIVTDLGRYTQKYPKELIKI